MTKPSPQLLATLLALCAAACSTTGRHDNPELPRGPVALRLRALDGSTITLGGYRGKVVLVTVMATWAESALLEVPRYKELAAKHAKEDLQIICVVLDEMVEPVEVFVDSFEPPYPVAFPEDPAALVGGRPFGPITAVPTSVLITRSGEIAARLDGLWPEGILEEAVERLLAQDPPSR